MLLVLYVNQDLFPDQRQSKAVNLTAAAAAAARFQAIFRRLQPNPLAQLRLCTTTARRNPDDVDMIQRCNLWTPPSPIEPLGPRFRYK